MDKILIIEAPFACRVGVSEEERGKPQDIVVDIEAFLDLHDAGQSDDFEKTVCYTAMHATAASIVAQRPFCLIETIAEKIAATILEGFPIQKIVVRVRKPAALARENVRYAAVEITREKDG